MSKRTGNDGTVGGHYIGADGKKEKGMTEWPFPYEYRVFGLFAENYVCSIECTLGGGCDLAVSGSGSIA